MRERERERWNHQKSKRIKPRRKDLFQKKEKNINKQQQIHNLMTKPKEIFKI